MGPWCLEYVGSVSYVYGVLGIKNVVSFEMMMVYSFARCSVNFFFRVLVYSGPKSAKKR